MPPKNLSREEVFAMAAKVDQDACVGCAACESACPAGAIKVDGKATVDEGACVSCGACTSACPVGAISL